MVGLRAYVAKNGFRSVLIGLSGGIDSALVAAIACDALGAQNVYGVSMPSKYSSEHSRGDAAELARRTGLNFRTVPIGPMFDTYMASLELTGLAEENLQSRLRGTLLMSVSNQEGHIVLAPGNKSELAVGYSTLYGDSVGAYGPIKDVYKTTVFRLAEWRNRAAAQRGQTPPIPENSITKPPSAELRPDQVDTDSLPDYPVLDAVLERYVDRDQGADSIVAAGFDAELVTRILRMTDTAEYKRRQYPPGTKISAKGFGKDHAAPDHQPLARDGRGTRVGPPPSRTEALTDGALQTDAGGHRQVVARGARQRPGRHRLDVLHQDLVDTRHRERGGPAEAEPAARRALGGTHLRGDRLQGTVVHGAVEVPEQDHPLHPLHGDGRPERVGALVTTARRETGVHLHPYRREMRGVHGDGPFGVATVVRIARVQPSLMSTGAVALSGYLLHTPTVPSTSW